MQQEQFLNVIDRDEAEQRFRAALGPLAPQSEEVPLSELLGRVLAEDVLAPVDVPGFDRSNVDGFALRATDTFGASEEEPRTLNIIADPLPPGRLPKDLSISSGTAVPIATGAVIPRGADAVVMIEDTEAGNDEVLVRRAVAPGSHITFAGTDIGRGETVLRQGTVLSSRETGVLAALGLPSVKVVRKPRVAILSTGDEILAPGAPMEPGLIFDSNATILADAVRELGCEPVPMGIVPDDADQLRERMREALAHDAALLSGGTSKGAGDISYRVITDLGEPGIVAHGIALKPGKPLCLAVVDRKPVVILPGFPTSAIFTFQDLVAPILREMAGLRESKQSTLPAMLPWRVASQQGRREYLLVSLVEGKQGYAAYPMGKGSGSVTSFSYADGFIIIPRQQEHVEAEEVVEVHPLAAELRPADLVAIGSHCVGLDALLGLLHRRGFSTKFLAVGSTGGLTAAKRGECDLAGIHLLDAKSGEYNRPFLTEDVEMLPGYGRLQGIVHRRGDTRFEGRSIEEAVRAALADEDCTMVNRNRGSGTRVLIDELLGEAKPPGYWVEARSHNAVVAAVAQGRADWGVAIEPPARAADLGFLPLREECYDFVLPKARMNRPAVIAFREILRSEEAKSILTGFGFPPRGS